MTRRFTRLPWPVVLLMAALTVRAAGCHKGSGTSSALKNATPPPGFPTPLKTPPPHRPTPTLYPGVTRVPELPE
jgi:hypothetical protein